MNTDNSFNYGAKQIIISPSRFYLNPKALVESDKFGPLDKYKALENWKNLIIQHQACDEEGMHGNSKQVEIKDIDSAMVKLKTASFY